MSLAVAYLRMKQYDKAFEEVNEAERLGGSPTRVLEIRGSVQAMSGDVAGAEATAEVLKSGKISGRTCPYSVALIYTALGRKSEALDWLDKAFQEKDTWSVWTKVLVEWDSLRDEPRFKELQRKLNL